MTNGIRTGKEKSDGVDHKFPRLDYGRRGEINRVVGGERGAVISKVD